MASHQWRIMASFTASGQVYGGPSSSPSYARILASKACLLCSLVDTALGLSFAPDRAVATSWGWKWFAGAAGATGPPGRGLGKHGKAGCRGARPSAGGGGPGAGVGGGLPGGAGPGPPGGNP